MLVALVLALAAVGAVAAHTSRWGRRLPRSRRTVYGALGGAAAGLLILPLLGLVAAVLFFAISLAAIAAVVLAVVLVARHLSGPRL